jgi:LacI family transcriptional regulator
MRDVAALAGVSLKTVSRVVNRERGVSGPLSERVDAAVALLGYRHNLAASSLRRSDRRTATIGLLLDDVSNPFDSALQRAVEDVARRHGSLVLAGSTDRDAALEAGVLQAFASRKVDGIIALPAGRDHRALLHEQRVGRPVVFVDRPDSSGLVDSVVVDNVAGAALAVRHLVAHGHRRIALLCDHEDVWTAGQRLRGFREGMLGCGLTPDPALVRPGVSGSVQARDTVRDLLALADPPTAVFTGQNLLTVGAVDAIRGAGGGVALVGFDDFPVADLLDPAVTVVSQDIAEIGRTAAELLFERLGGSHRPAVTVVTEPRLVVRGSGELPGPADEDEAIAG